MKIYCYCQLLSSFPTFRYGCRITMSHIWIYISNTIDYVSHMNDYVSYINIYPTSRYKYISHFHIWIYIPLTDINIYHTSTKKIVEILKLTLLYKKISISDFLENKNMKRKTQIFPYSTEGGIRKRKSIRIKIIQYNIDKINIFNQ